MTRQLTLLLTFSGALAFALKISAQININNYVNDDLFKVKPVISTNDTEVKREQSFDFLALDIQKGVRLLDENQLDEAIYYFKELDSEYKDEYQISFYLGMAFFQKGNDLEAEDNFLKSLNRNPLYLIPAYYLALIEMNTGDLKAAKVYADRLISIEDYKALGYFCQAQIGIKEENIYKSHRMYQKCIDANPNFLEAYIPLATIEFTFNPQGKNAKLLMDKAVELFPEWEEGIIARALFSILYDQQNIVQFETDILKLISLDPENYHYYSINGYLNIELKKYEQALDNFKLAYNLDSQNSNQGEFKTKFQRNITLKEGINYYYQYKFKLSNEASRLLDKGICFAINEEYKKAELCIDSVFTKSEHSVVPLWKGIILDLRYKETSALRYFSEAIEKDQTNVLAFIKKGDILTRQEKYDSAILDYSSLIRLNPKSKEGYKKRSSVLVHTGEYRRGYVDLTRGILIDSLDTDLYFNRAFAAHKLKYYKESNDDLSRFLTLKKADAEAYYLMSLNYLYLKDTISRFIFLDSASRIAKYNESYHIELANLSKETNQPEMIIEAYSRLIKYASYKSMYYYQRGMAHYEIGNYELAVRDFRDLLHYHKDHIEGTYFLGKTLINLGNEKEGLKHLEKAKKLGFQGNR